MFNFFMCDLQKWARCAFSTKSQKSKLIFFEIFDIASAASITTWKVSKYGLFLSLFSRIWDEYGTKYGPEKTFYLDTPSLACIIITFYDLPACRSYNHQISYMLNRTKTCKKQTAPLKI